MKYFLFGAPALCLSIFTHTAFCDGPQPQPQPQAEELKIVDRTLFVTPEVYNNNAVGTAASIGAGVQWSGLRTFVDHRLELQWDTMAAARVATISGQPAPGFGLQAHLGAEFGYRPLTGTWSPYAGVGAQLGADAIYVPGTTLGNMAALNFFKYDGTNGLIAGRFNLGVSRLDENSALALNAFVQEAFRYPEGLALQGPSVSNALEKGIETDVGLHAQYDDLKRKVRAMFEILYGTTTSVCTICDRYVVWEGKAGLKKGFTAGKTEIWLGVDLDVESDQLKHAYPQIIPDPAANVSETITGTAAIVF